MFVFSTRFTISWLNRSNDYALSFRYCLEYRNFGCGYGFCLDMSDFVGRKDSVLN